jgi:subtilisin family serine protease
MPYATRILMCLASALCAGALAFQMTGTATAAQAVQTCPYGRVAFPPANPPPPLAPLRNENSALQITGSYIVVVQPTTNAAIWQGNTFKDGIAIAGAVPVRTYTTAILGYAVQFPMKPTSGQIDQLRRLPCVDYVEADLRGTYNQAPMGPPRGLDRIDQRTPSLNQTYNPLGLGKGADGNGVHVYVIDSGIETNHNQFGPMKRASSDYVVYCQVGPNNPSDPRPSCTPRDLDDCNGHATAVAGVIGGKDVGVAKGVYLHSVRVSDPNCALSASNMVAGIEWVKRDVIATRARNPSDSPYLALVNMSLSVGPGRDSSLDDAVADLIRTAGVAFVASAGNRHLDACSFSPGGGALEAITVGAMQSEGRDVVNLPNVSNVDSEPAFTNFGPCVDLFAPGAAIDTAQINGTPAPQICDTDSSRLPHPRRGMLCGGTSMAAAHVSGCIALYLQAVVGAAPPPDRPAMRTPEGVWTWLWGRANHKGTPGFQDSWGGILSGEIGGLATPQPPPPVLISEFDDPPASGGVDPPPYYFGLHPGTPNVSLYCGP